MTYNITLKSNPSYAGFTSGEGTYDLNDFITINAYANPYWRFVEWKNESNVTISTRPEYIYEVTANQTLTAHFALIKPQLYLTKPDRTTVGILDNAYGVNLSRKLGDVSELEFTMSYNQDFNNQIIENLNIDKINIRYCVKLKIDDYEEWFLIDKITDSQDEADQKTIQCYSLSYELSNAILRNYRSGVSIESNLELDFAIPVIPEKALEEVLIGLNTSNPRTIWTVGSISDKISGKFRAYEAYSKTVLEFILQDIADDLGVYAIFDTENRTVSLVHPEDNVFEENSSMLFSYGKYLESIDREYDTQDFCTRLIPVGGDNLTIEEANPTGRSYIDDLSYFLNTDYMEQSLIDKINNYYQEIEDVTGENRIEFIAQSGTDEDKAVKPAETEVISIGDFLLNRTRDNQWRQIIDVSGNDVIIHVDDPTKVENKGIGQLVKSDVFDVYGTRQIGQLFTFNFTKNITKINWIDVFINFKTGSSLGNLEMEIYDSSAGVTLATIVKNEEDIIPGTIVPFVPSSPISITPGNVIFFRVYQEGNAGDIENYYTVSYSDTNVVDPDEYMIRGTPLVEEIDKNLTYHINVEVYEDTKINGQAEDDVIYVYKNNDNTFRGLLFQLWNEQDKLLKLQNKQLFISIDAQITLDAIGVSHDLGQNPDPDLYDNLESMQNEINDLQVLIDNVNAEIFTISAQIGILVDNFAMENNFTSAELTEINKFIIEKEWDNSSIYDVIDLYDEAKIVMEEMSKPKEPININIVNFYECLEEQYEYGNLELGKRVRIKHDKFGIDKSTRILELDFDYDDKDVDIVLSNPIRKVINSQDRVESLFQKTNNSINTLNGNKTKWDNTSGNFSGRNSRKSSIPSDPVILGELTSTPNLDGTANINFSWQYTNTDIDGFFVFVRNINGLLNPPVYYFGSSAVQEQDYTISFDRRNYTLYGVPATDWYFMGVQAFRYVDADIRPDGIIKSNIAQHRTLDGIPIAYKPSDNGVFENSYVNEHANRIDNPHSVTKTQVGLSEVDNVKQTPFTHIGTGGNAHALVTTSSNGFMSSIDKTKLDNAPADTNEIFEALKEPTGFENRTDSTLAFSVVSNQAVVTLTTATLYNIWFSGIKKTIGTTKSITINDEEGLWAVWFDTDEELYATKNPGYGDMLDIIKNKVFVALLYWDATNKEIVYDGEERHGIIMDGITHYYLHFTRGLQWVEGLGLGDFVIGNGSLNTHAQFSVGQGLIADEDLGFTVSEIISTTGLPILYRIGASGYWRRLEQAGFSCYRGANTRLSWNEYDTGINEWKLSEVVNNRFVLYHIFMTTGFSNKIFSIMGQETYANASSARSGANQEISDLLLGELPSEEIRPLGTVIFQTGNTYGNDVNARIVLTEDGEEYVDWRTSDLPRGSTPTAHGNLTGLSNDDHLQYALLADTRGDQTFDGNIILSGDASTAVTQTAGNNTTRIATTAFVQDNFSALGNTDFEWNDWSFVVGSAFWLRHEVDGDGEVAFFKAGGTTGNFKVTVIGDLQVSLGNASVDGDLSVTGSATIDNNLNVKGSYQRNGNAGVTQNVTIGDTTLTIEGGIITNVSVI